MAQGSESGEVSSIHRRCAPLTAIRSTRRLLYSGSRSPALSPPAFEQCPLLLGVRADRPTSAIDRSAYERSCEYPSLDIHRRSTTTNSTKGRDRVEPSVPNVMAHRRTVDRSFGNNRSREHGHGCESFDDRAPARTRDRTCHRPSAARASRTVTERRADSSRS